jgi:hypothetical protein
MKISVLCLSYLAQFSLEYESFQKKKKDVEKIKTHILCSAATFSKIVPKSDNVDRCCKAGQATDKNMVHEHCMLDT